MKTALALALLLSLSGAVMAQDSDYVRAEKTLDQIDNGLRYLQRNDVDGYNRLTEKLAAARTLLEGTTSKDHPGYKALTNRWNAARQRLVAVAEEWRSAPAPAPQAPAPQPRTPQAPSARPTTTAAPQQTSREIYEGLMAKYQQANRPGLPADPGTEQIRTWVQGMRHLLGPQMEADTRLIEAEFAAGRVTKDDRSRFDRWVRGTFAEQIRAQLQQVRQALESGIVTGLERADAVSAVQDDDRTAVMNTAGSYGDANLQALDVGLAAVEAAAVFDTDSPDGPHPDRADQTRRLQDARAKLIRLAALNERYQAEWAELPKKSRKDPTSQYLWLDGSRFCEITAEGEVWKNGSFAGTITADGAIWVRGNDVGSIEPDGAVWHRGTQVGTLTPEGAVWRGGSQVGSVGKDGEVWVGGSSRGTVEGPGDWKRAAVVYFYDFY